VFFWLCENQPTDDLPFDALIEVRYKDQTLKITSISVVKDKMLLGTIIDTEEIGNDISNFKKNFLGRDIKIKTKQSLISSKVKEVDGYISKHSSKKFNLFFNVEIDSLEDVDVGDNLILN